MDVRAWLRGLGLERYAQAFLDAEVTSEVLAELTEADLRELGLQLGPRKAVLKAIRNRATAPTPAATVGVAADKAGSVTPPIAAGAERRQLTLMFVDLVGSTALSARLDPEDLRDVISAYHARVAAGVERLGGFIAKYMGDGVLAYFGYLVAHEDDAERSVRAGLELVTAVRELAVPTGTALRVRIGIAT